MNLETLYMTELCARERGLVAACPSEAGPGFRWDRFLDAAECHKVVGLVYQAFSSGRAPAPPADVLAQLKRKAAAKAAIKAMLLAEWQRVYEALRAASIRVLMIKGPALALQLYGDPNAREFRDIDLMVDAGTMERVVVVFSSLGYELSYPDPELEPELGKAKREFLIATVRHIAFKKKEFPAFFEVHGVKGNDIGLAPIGIEAAFARSERLTFEGMSFPTLGREDHALLALLHGAYHSWCTLQWVLDAAVLLENSYLLLMPESTEGWTSIDPQYALDSFALMASRLFYLPALDSFYPPQGSRARRGMAFSKYALARLAGDGADRSNFFPIIEDKIALSRLYCGFIPKLRSWAWIVRPNSNDFAAFRGVDPPLFVYYLARPFLVLTRIVKRLAGRRAARET
jgi:hypothetical protein